MVALLAEGVDRNPGYEILPFWKDTSPSSRRAWIEIYALLKLHILPSSPSSRRAWIEIIAIVPAFAALTVALLAEGVDRNILDGGALIPDLEVALLAEGVDRNFSSRRQRPSRYAVALLAEGVDRNIMDDATNE